MKITLFLLSLILLMQFPGKLYAHHAMEYIELESYNTARKGEFVFHLHYDYFVDDNTNPSLDHWEFTPGISFGLSNRLMLDIHTHFAKFWNDHIVNSEKENYSPLGPSPFFEAAALSIQYRVTTSLPVNISVAGTYEIPFGRAKTLLGSHEVFESVLILGFDFGEHSNITTNIKAGMDGRNSFTEWGLGIKTPLSRIAHGISGGLEFLGDFNGNISLLAGVYFPLGAENIIVKTGLLIGNSRNERLNTTLMYRF